MTNSHRTLLRAAFLTCGLLGGSAWAQASSLFSYHVYDFPRTDAGCVAEAAALGERVAAQTGVSIFKTACEGEFATDFSLSVTYQANEQLNVINLFDGSVENQGSYATLVDCKAALDDQVAHFKTATGLEPIIAYCTSGYVDSNLSFGVRLEAFGSPAVYPHFFGDVIFGYPQGDIAAATARIAESARAEGLDVFKTAISSGTMEFYFSLGYYGTDPVPLKMSDSVAFASPEDCAAQTAMVEGYFHDGGEAVLGSFCARMELSDISKLYVASLAKTGSVFTETENVQFDTMVACETDKQRVLDIVRTDHPDTFVGGLCSVDAYSGTYQVTAFLKLGERR